MIAETLRAVERFLLPNDCVACRRLPPPTQPDALICDVCVTRFRPVGRGCDRCEQPLPPLGPCRFCAEWQEVLREVRSAYWLTDETRAVVHHLKYRSCASLGDAIADWISRRLTPGKTGYLIPVPTTARRQRLRGYNQAELIARGLGRRWCRPVAAGVLSRLSDSESQTALTPEARSSNVAGAFAAKRPPRGAEAAALVIDDVLTTGATVNACATALAEAGWTTVHAVTFARAMPYEMAAL